VLYSVCRSAWRRKERLPLSATSASSQPTTPHPSAPPFSLSGTYHGLVGAPILPSPVPHYPPNSFPLNLFADPHPLNPVVSIFYKNIGGRGHLHLFSPEMPHSCALFYTFLHSPKTQPAYSQAIPHSFTKTRGWGRSIRLNRAASRHTQTEPYCGEGSISQGRRS
jgi:hypothetical protein